jgi:hypothetical protein
MLDLMPRGYPGGYGAYYREVIKPREDAITPEQQKINSASHIMGMVDDCIRCINCEVASWNSWKTYC